MVRSSDNFVFAQEFLQETDKPSERSVKLLFNYLHSVRAPRPLQLRQSF